MLRVVFSFLSLYRFLLTIWNIKVEKIEFQYKG
jgi:hypothetical protein